MYLSKFRNRKIEITHAQFMGLKFDVLRLDLLDNFSTGNKLFKLRYSIQEILNSDCHIALTFGGAFSNHIAAFAHAGRLTGIQTIGIIRGEQPDVLNPTLVQAEQNGMHLYFLNREAFRRKDLGLLEPILQSKYDAFHVIPEGGSSELGLKGAAEILKTVPSGNKTIFCPVGTGGTLAGLVLSQYQAEMNGIDVVGLGANQKMFISASTGNKYNWKLHHEYTFGGYAQVTSELINFMRALYTSTNIKTDPVYTAKMFFGAIQYLKNNTSDNSVPLLVHTGGLQGLNGYEWLNGIKIYD